MHDREQARVDTTRNAQFDARYDSAKQASPIQGYAPAEAQSLRRASIRQRIDAALREGERGFARMEAAQRARQIIDQHPEFADLLDALGEF